MGVPAIVRVTGCFRGHLRGEFNCSWRTWGSDEPNRETFNHAFTNFALTGAHKRASCDGCHAKNTKYRETPGRCFDCHRSSDPHKGRLGEKCEGCHSEESWRRVKSFDHSKTKFPLLAAHKQVACTKCHAGERYAGLATTCVSCHSLQDKHAGRNGSNCETCHAPTKWTTLSFDPNKATRFALRGDHAKLACERCHTSNARRDRLATDCVACHRKNDPHKGQLGAACDQCHKETGWRQAVAFDHDLTQLSPASGCMPPSRASNAIAAPPSKTPLAPAPAATRTCTTPAASGPIAQAVTTPTAGRVGGLTTISRPATP